MNYKVEPYDPDLLLDWPWPNNSDEQELIQLKNQIIDDLKSLAHLLRIRSLL